MVSDLTQNWVPGVVLAAESESGIKIFLNFRNLIKKWDAAPDFAYFHQWVDKRGSGAKNGGSLILFKVWPEMQFWALNLNYYHKITILNNFYKTFRAAKPFSFVLGGQNPCLPNWFKIGFQACFCGLNTNAGLFFKANRLSKSYNLHIINLYVCS